jgi:hypothetical protein
MFKDIFFNNMDVTQHSLVCDTKISSSFRQQKHINAIAALYKIGLKWHTTCNTYQKHNLMHMVIK